MVTNTGIGTDTNAHALNIRTTLLGDIRQFVHETDLGGQHRVGGIFGEFRGADVHADHAIVAAVKRFVKGSQQLRRARVVRADDDAIGFHEIINRVALFEEFRVRDDIAFMLDATLFECRQNCLLDFVRRADRHRRFVDDDPIVIHVLTDRLRDGEHILHIRGTVLVGRCADRDKLKQAVINTLRHVGRKLKATRRHVAFNVIIQSGLIDRHFTGIEPLDPVCIDIDAHNVIAHFGHAGTGDQANVA